jgi:3-hydroxyacyl-CoA dehydrogenase
MQNRIIRKVAVLGSGVMGSRIACHFAGTGHQVLLLDIPAPGSPDAASSPDPKSDPKAAAAAKAARNKLVQDALTAAIKSNPSPVYAAEVTKNIKTGNFDDDLAQIANCDWIIEVVVERLEIKQQLFERVEKFRKPGTLISSNTSGIPIRLMNEGRSEDFRKHFCGTHFFNPPRYLRLLEIIPGPDTDQSVIDFLVDYGDRILGKSTVLCKDTPAFIANRIGVYSIMQIFKLSAELGLGIDAIDTLTGPVIGRPKSATFRTADVVGIDTLVKVAQGVQDNCPNDEQKAVFTIPAWLHNMINNKWLGDKTGQGFFKKTKNAQGEKEILTLQLNTLEYGPREKPKFAALETTRAIDDLKQRLPLLVGSQDKAGEFYRAFHYGLFSYISFRIPEIADELYRIDDAMKAGFGWEIGAFESWDVLGVAKTVEKMKASGYAPAPWVESMLANNIQSFYKLEGGKKYYYDFISQSYVAVPGGESFISVGQFKEKTVWKNASCTLVDLGDEVLGLQWNTKMGSIGGDVLSGIQKSIELAEKSYRGLVIANEGPNFSAGANVGMIFMLAIEQDYDELDMAIRLFQQTMMRVRYSGIPVVVAPHGLALGGACELSLHADKCCPAAETYTGLVELGVGLIPGGGGTKEFALRAADELHKDEPDFNTLKHRFFSIATAKVGTSAEEGFQIGVYRKGIDEISYNLDRRVFDAKKSVIDLSEKGYVQPIPRTDVMVPGRSALGALYAGINGMWRAGYATDHDALVARKLAYVMCGGDLSEPTAVSEQYLLDLEREAFLSLCGERKTLERIQSVLKGGKPVRN